MEGKNENKEETSPFDPTDPAFQVSKKHKPDKETKWCFPKEQDGWVHAHNMLRKEINSIIECLSALEMRGVGGDKPVKPWEIQALQSIFDVHLLNIHTHHENEDKCIAPALRKRFKFPEEHVQDHVELVKVLNRLTKMFGELTTTAHEAGQQQQQQQQQQQLVLAIKELIAAMQEYSQFLEPHMKDEEDRALPLMRAYFTPREFKKIMLRVFIRAPKSETGSFVYCMGEDRFRKEFMKQENIPGVVWNMKFKPALAWYETNVVVKVNALKSGVEPMQTTTCACSGGE